MIHKHKERKHSTMAHSHQAGISGKKNRDDETLEMPEKNLSSTPNRTDDHIGDPKKEIRKSIQDIDKKLPK